LITLLHLVGVFHRKNCCMMHGSTNIKTNTFLGSHFLDNSLSFSHCPLRIFSLILISIHCQILDGSLLPYLHINEASRSESYISRNCKSRRHPTTFRSNMGRNNSGLRRVRNRKALILVVFHLENFVWRGIFHIM